MAAVDTAAFGLAAFILIIWCIHWCIHITAIFYGKYRLHRTAVVDPENSNCQPGVSILKPLKGIDANLYENLETFFHLKYPVYEVIFCVEEDIDPVIMVIQSFLEKYGSVVDARLFIGAKRIGLNPKINNIMQGYQASKYDLVLISDSGMKMKEDTLSDMVFSMTEDVALVHQLPFVCDKQSFPGILEKIHFGTHLAKMYLVADLLGVNCVTGMSCLMRKQMLDDNGGLKSLVHFLAEDYYMGEKCLESGWKMTISSQPAWQNAGGVSVAALHDRMIRWIKLRTALSPLLIVLEPLVQCWLLGVLSSLSASYVLQWSGLAFLFTHVLVWFMLDYCLLNIIQDGSLPCSKFHLVTCWLFKEMTAIYLCVKAHTSKYLVWRGTTYRLKWGALGQEVTFGAVGGREVKYTV